jgi:hypothetical protein
MAVQERGYRRVNYKSLDKALRCPASIIWEPLPRDIRQSLEESVHASGIQKHTEPGIRDRAFRNVDEAVSFNPGFGSSGAIRNEGREEWRNSA